jgi:DNA-binding MarR family transcriptional regulator
MATRRNTEPPAYELIRYLAQIYVFYAEASAAVIGPRVLHHARLLALREASLGSGVQLKALQEILRCKPFTATRIAKFLERKGWVQIARDHKDGRSRILAATPKGRQEIRKVDEALERAMIHRMPDSAYKTERWREAIGAAERLNGALQTWIL